MCVSEVADILHTVLSLCFSAPVTRTETLSLSLKNSVVTCCLPMLLVFVNLCVYFFPIFYTSVFFLFFTLTHTLAPSLHLPVKRRSFLLVVIKSKVGCIRESVFESSSGCQRAFIPRPLDVPLMASLCLSFLPTMPLLIHQPIIALRHCGPQNAFFVCVEVPTPGREGERAKDITNDQTAEECVRDEKRYIWRL